MAIVAVVILGLGLGRIGLAEKIVDHGSSRTVGQLPRTGELGPAGRVMRRLAAGQAFATVRAAGS